MADIGTVFPLICPLKMQQVLLSHNRRDYSLPLPYLCRRVQWCVMYCWLYEQTRLIIGSSITRLVASAPTTRTRTALGGDHPHSHEHSKVNHFLDYRQFTVLIISYFWPLRPLVAFDEAIQGYYSGLFRAVQGYSGLFFASKINHLVKVVPQFLIMTPLHGF